MASPYLQTSDPVELLGDITLNDPLAAVLLVGGIAIMVYTMGVAGYLTAGAIVDLFSRPFE